jgi:hypothetical protein
MFFRLCDIALAQDEARDIMLIGRGVKFAPALQWKLMRKAPARWGERIHQTVEVAGLLAGPEEEEQSIEHDADTQAKMLAVLEASGAFDEQIKQADEELNATVQTVDGKEIPVNVKRVNGSGKK